MCIKKCKCGGDIFKIVESTSCDDCRANGVWDEDNEKYVHKGSDIVELNKRMDDCLSRTQCSDEGYCDHGDNHNSGCWVFECINCDKEEMIPRIED